MCEVLNEWQTVDPNHMLYSMAFDLGPNNLARGSIAKWLRAFDLTAEGCRFRPSTENSVPPKINGYPLGQG